MPETIYKLQPNRALHLRGFDGLGASAALHQATATGFQVSGSFSDSADFAVLVLHDADNFFEHPRLRFLPDFDFDGLTLSFEVRYENLMRLDSTKYPTIDWPYLDVIREDGTPAQIRLETHATIASGQRTAASGSIDIVAGGLRRYDRLTLWYLNYAFDYAVPQVECSFVFFGTGIEGTVHSLTVDGTEYATTEVAGDTNTSITGRIAAAAAASPRVTVAQVAGNQIDVANAVDDGSAYTVSSSGGGSFVLHGTGPVTVARSLAQQINSTAWGSTAFPLTAAATGNRLQLTAARPGEEGNELVVYAVANGSRLTTSVPELRLAGGSNDVTWRIQLDFAALGIPRIRQMWLTFAPPLPYGSPLSRTEWRAVFSNWSVTGPLAKRQLKVAGPDSVRVEENSSWCQYSGDWRREEGFYSDGHARRAEQIGDRVTVKYACAVVHDLYVGTSLAAGQGTVGVRLDGDAETELVTALAESAPVITRRKVRSSVPPGVHFATLTLKNAKPFIFDFLEAAVPGDVPDPLPGRAHASPALDYSTDHTYKLSPSRLHWQFDRLGFTGPMNLYLGVFWWNQRRAVNQTLAAVHVQFSGTWQAGDQIQFTIGSQVCGKYCFGGESNDLLARHFAWFVNATYVGVWAEALGDTVTIRVRSAAAAYAFPFSATVTPAATVTGSITVTGALTGSVAGIWEIDPAVEPVLNAGARAWLSDFLTEAAHRDREVTLAASMELVQPPGTFAARFPDGAAVETSVGFGALRSTHCAFSTPMLGYQKRLFTELAAAMIAAGRVPSLQFGEFVWWFFTNWSAQHPAGGMAFYDAETAAHAAQALGRPLHRFLRPTDDPSVNGSADARFLADRLRDYVAALRTHVQASSPGARFELLFPYDVNHPQPAGVHQLGGALNRFVNFPTAWESKASSGLDRIKMEALDFGAWSRNLILARTAMEFPILLGWPRDSIRYLIPVFRPAAAWEREYQTAKGLQIPVLNFWAFDHFCIYGLKVEEPRPAVTFTVS